MSDRGQAHATAGEPVTACVKTKHMLASVRGVLGMSSRKITAPGQKIRKGARVAVQMPFSYRAITNNRVMPETFHGTILNIGYHGMLADLNQPLPAGSEIRLTLDTLSSHAKMANIDASAAKIYARIIDNRPINGWNLSGTEFTCVSAQSEKLLMHCMLHTAHASNPALDEHMWQHEREVTKKTGAWQIVKRVIFATLLAASTALFYLVWVLNEAISVPF